MTTNEFAQNLIIAAEHDIAPDRHLLAMARLWLLLPEIWQVTQSYYVNSVSDNDADGDKANVAMQNLLTKLSTLEER